MLTPKEFIHISYKQKREKVLSILHLYHTEKTLEIRAEIEEDVAYDVTMLEQIYDRLYISASDQISLTYRKGQEKKNQLDEVEVESRRKELEEVDALLLSL